MRMRHGYGVPKNCAIMHVVRESRDEPCFFLHCSPRRRWYCEKTGVASNSNARAHQRMLLPLCPLPTSIHPTRLSTCIHVNQARGACDVKVLEYGTGAFVKLRALVVSLLLVFGPGFGPPGTTAPASDFLKRIDAAERFLKFEYKSYITQVCIGSCRGCFCGTRQVLSHVWFGLWNRPWRAIPSPVPSLDLRAPHTTPPTPCGAALHPRHQPALHDSPTHVHVVVDYKVRVRHCLSW